MKRIRLAGQLAEPISHYTDGVEAGGFLYISGMLPMDAAGVDQPDGGKAAPGHFWPEGGVRPAERVELPHHQRRRRGRTTAAR